MGNPAGELRTGAISRRAVVTCRHTTVGYDWLVVKRRDGPNDFMHAMGAMRTMRRMGAMRTWGA